VALVLVVVSAVSILVAVLVMLLVLLLVDVLLVVRPVIERRQPRGRRTNPERVSPAAGKWLGVAAADGVAAPVAEEGPGYQYCAGVVGL
jgi:uncharacterized protein (DUF58 family)